MRLSFQDDFLSADGDLSITAHDEQGIASNNVGRHCVSTFKRVAAIGKKAIVVAALAASTMSASFAQSPHNESNAASGDSFLSTSKVVADAAVDRFSKEVLMDSISPTVKKIVSKIEIQSDEHERALNNGKGGSPEMQVNLSQTDITCTMHLSGMKEVIQNVYNDDYNKLSELDLGKIRKAIIRHEASHCELGALELQEISRNSNASILRKNVADTFMVSTIDGTSLLHRADFAGSLINERSADSRAVLLTAKDDLGSLTKLSTPDEVKMALDRFYDDSLFYYKLRTEEMKTASEQGMTSDDHDTLHVIDSLISSIREKVRDRGEFEKWKGATLTDEGIDQLAMQMAIGSTMSERGKILLSQINVEIEDIGNYVASREKILEKANQSIAENQIKENRAMALLKASMPQGSAPVTDEDIANWDNIGGFTIASQIENLVGKNPDHRSKEYADAKKQVEQDLLKSNHACVHASAIQDARFAIEKAMDTKEQEEDSLPAHVQKIKDLQDAKAALEAGFQMEISMDLAPNDEKEVKSSVAIFNAYAVNSQPNLSVTYAQKMVNDAMLKKSAHDEDSPQVSQGLSSLMRKLQEKPAEFAAPKP